MEYLYNATVVHHGLRKSKFFLSSKYDGKTRRCAWVNCGACGRRFIKPVARIRSRVGCSILCRARLRRTCVTRKCPVCKKAFLARPSRIAQAKGPLCCSRNCRSTAQRINSGVMVSRPENWGKSGGRSEAARIRKSFGPKAKCVACGITFRPVLTLHHIDGDDQNNTKSNLEIVCWLHHAIRHMVRKGKTWTYSTKHLTPRRLLHKLERLVATTKLGGVVQRKDASSADW